MFNKIPSRRLITASVISGVLLPLATLLTGCSHPTDASRHEGGIRALPGMSRAQSLSAATEAYRGYVLTVDRMFADKERNAGALREFATDHVLASIAVTLSSFIDAGYHADGVSTISSPRLRPVTADARASHAALEVQLCEDKTLLKIEDESGDLVPRMTATRVLAIDVGFVVARDGRVLVSSARKSATNDYCIPHADRRFSVRRSSSLRHA